MPPLIAKMPNDVGTTGGGEATLGSAAVDADSDRTAGLAFGKTGAG